MKRLELDFEGRILPITGAATGIGRATALAFAAARAAVVIRDVDPGSPRPNARIPVEAASRRCASETDDD